jgi:excisionase family DNA binding protein
VGTLLFSMSRILFYQQGERMETKLLRGPEVAEILSISKALAYRLIAQGSLPAVKFGRTVRVRPEDLIRFISDNLTHKESERIVDV